MGFHNADALLLDVRDFQERDRIVTFLTAAEGKASGVARGARRPHSRFAGQLQPLARVRLAWFEKEGVDLVRLSGVELQRPAARLQEDLEGLLLGSYLSEHLLVFAQENEPSDLLFRLLDSTLEALLAGVDQDLAARYFEAWILRLAGIFPAPDQCPLCGGGFDGRALLANGGEALVCLGCGSGQPGLSLDDGVLAFLRRIGVESLRKMADRPPDSEVLQTVELLARTVRRSFLQRELRSYRVMKDTLAL